MIIRSKAPLRLGLAGGGTDIPPYPERHGGLVLNATINLYALTTLVPNRTETYSVYSVDYDYAANFKSAQKYKFDDNLDLVKGVIRRLKYNDLGFELLTRCDAPPGTGLGSSSAMTAAATRWTLASTASRLSKASAMAVSAMAIALSRSPWSPNMCARWSCSLRAALIAACRAKATPAALATMCSGESGNAPIGSAALSI